MKDSIFTKIVSGEVPCHKVYEDDKTLAFLDVFPKNEGHTLVIPKIKPTEFVWDLEDDIYQAVMDTVKRVAIRQRKILGYKYMHSSVVGTDVPYAHIHVIAFDTTDQLHGPERDKLEPDHDSLAKIAEKLRF